VLVRATSAVSGYFNAPELSAKTFDAEGWVHTRDMGLLDARGFLHLRDRKSDMIITGGYNVYPLEVENALMTHSAVRECAVVGTPDEKWVEIVTATVALHAGRQVSEQALIAHVAAQVASYKKPARVVFLPEIPKTAVGKLNRRAVREMLRAA
jgi:acyl-CoA synthetase (AMP-forming)/AMP-acid ligase II